MRRFFKILASLILLLIITAIVAPFFIPADKLKAEVLAEIQAKTGRKVDIGKLSFTLFPTITLNAEDVKVGNPDWAGGGDMAEIKKLKFGIELMPLLHGEKRIKELTLEQPVLTLVKQHGRANWDFSQTGAKTAPAAAAAPAEAPAPKGGGALSQLANLHLEDIAIHNGSATYKDDASNRPESIQNLNFELKAPNVAEKAAIDFSGTYNGHKTSLSLVLKEPLAFESGKPTDIALKAAYDALNFTYAGTATLVRDNIPSLTGKLVVPTLDTTEFSQKGGDSTPAATHAAPAAAKPAGSGGSRWSDEPIHLEGLARIDADLTVSIGKLVLPKTTLDNVDATLKLRQGSLIAQVQPISAYGGTLSLGLALNTAGAMNFNLNASHAQAEPLLHDFASYDRLSGVIDTSSRLTANGLSERALIGSLTGSGSFQFHDGKLKGVNIAALLKNVTGAQGSDNDSTEFSDLSGSYTASRGVITTNDLKMASPLLRMSGSGDADLPNWQEHFLLKPTLVASAQGQGGKDAAGIVVPVDVEGPIDHPHYQPDLKAALEENLGNLKDPKALKAGVKNLKNTLLQGGGSGNGGGGLGGLGGLLR